MEAGAYELGVVVETNSGYEKLVVRRDKERQGLCKTFQQDLLLGMDR